MFHLPLAFYRAYKFKKTFLIITKMIEREREIHVEPLEVPMGKGDGGWSLRDI
jgi:hypothetical protein